MMSAGPRAAKVRAARRWHWVITQLPFFIVLLFVLIALGFVMVDRWRRGALVFGIGALATSLLRAILPTSRAGLLAVRSRPTDVIVTAIVGAAIIWLAASIDSLGTDLTQ